MLRLWVMVRCIKKMGICGAMNRSSYFNFIEEKLSSLAFRIERRGKLNILDYHVHSENFYQYFMNILFNWHLENMNTKRHNIEAIDLIDKNNKIVIQVSATATKQKIESALNKNLSNMNGYSFKFISISQDAKKLRKLSYKNPHNLTFDPQLDIFDIDKLLNIIIYLDIERQKTIYDFIKKELGKETDLTRVDSNLTRIINILARENWDSETCNYQINAFEIDRKIEHNSLNHAKTLIEEFAANSNRVDIIYKEFNQGGVNKSSSVLASIQNIYITNKASQSDDILFFNVISQVIHRIQNSTNYMTIPFEELELCVNIIVVDAFIRCKIFENPEGYMYAAT